MQKVPPPFRAGQHVTVRDEPWLVVHTESFDTTTLVTLHGIGDDNRGDTNRVLVPFDVVELRAPSTRIRQRSHRAVLATAALTIADAPRWNECWTAAAASIEVRSWQLDPAIAAVGGVMRILLADEVGLGKTVQASLIVAELLARGLAQRVLVLTPASLREQWASEMSDRFGLSPAILDQVTLAALSAMLPVTVNPWKATPLIVSSVDLVKRPEIRTALAAVPFDVLIVDEAHHLVHGTDRAAVVADLAARTPWVVLATATPHSGDDTAYRFLLSIGDVGTDQMVAFRRSAAHLRPAGVRRSKLLAVRTTAAERALLDGTLAYVRGLWRSPEAGAASALVASIIARRAASSAFAARKTLERRVALLRGNAPAQRQTRLPWDDADTSDDDISDDVLAVRGMSDTADEIEQLEQLAALAAAAEGCSSKVKAIRRLLRRTTEQLIVFSEYRDVVDRVAAGVGDLARTAVLHGALTPRERRDAIRAFTQGRVRTLVATDAAGEGLNLQERCRLVVNLELPWNPLRLEQRVGRVDRIGQTRRVHAVHLVHHDSFEATVVARLQHRTGSTQLPFTTPLDATEPSAKVERRLRLLGSGLHNRDGVAVYAGGRTRGRELHLLFAANVVDHSGRLVQRHVTAIRAATSHRRLTRRWLRRCVANATVRVVLGADVGRAVEAAQQCCATSAVTLEQRCRAIEAALRALRQRTTFQGSLFDRRAEHVAHAQQSALSDLQSHLHRRIEGAQALRRVSARPPRLVAAWIGE